VLTPAETQEWIGEREKGDLELAWRIAVLQRAEKLPKSPERIWSPADDGMTVGLEMLVPAAQARREEKKAADKSKDKSKPMKKRDTRRGR
jgi:hypothetical protein